MVGFVAGDTEPLPPAEPPTVVEPLPVLGSLTEPGPVLSPAALGPRGGLEVGLPVLTEPGFESGPGAVEVEVTGVLVVEGLEELFDPEVEPLPVLSCEEPSV